MPANKEMVNGRIFAKRISNIQSGVKATNIICSLPPRYVFC